LSTMANMPIRTQLTIIGRGSTTSHIQVLSLLPFQFFLLIVGSKLDATMTKRTLSTVCSAAETGGLFGTFAFISKRLSLTRCHSVNPPHFSPCFYLTSNGSVHTLITHMQFFFSTANLITCLQLFRSLVSFYNKKSKPDSMARDSGRQTNVDDSILYLYLFSTGALWSRVGRN
jgi:hypothetical protein